MYSPGEVLNVVFNSTLPMSNKEIKLWNRYRNSNITRVIVHSVTADGMYHVIPCRENKTKHSIPVKVSGITMHASYSVLETMDGSILSRFPNSKMEDCTTTLEKINSLRDVYLAKQERKKSKKNKLLNSYSLWTTNTANLEYDTLIIQHKPDNVVCPVCRKLLPTGNRHVRIEGEGLPMLRVGACSKCGVYYSFSNKLLHKDGEYGGLPVIWSGLRYQSGNGEKIRFKTMVLVKQLGLGPKYGTICPI